MQILTKLLIACAIAATISPISSRAADTDAQIKAREALRQKMNELEVQPMETNAAPTVAAPSKKPKVKPTPAPTVSQPAPAQTVRTVPAPVQTPPPAVEMPMRTPPPAPAPTVRTPPPAKMKPVAKSSQMSGQVTASRPDSEKVAKARAALEDKMKELQEPGGASTQPAVAASTPAPSRSTPAPVVSNPAPVAHTPEVGSSAPQPTVNTEPNEPLPTPPPVRKSAQAEHKKSKEPKTPRPMPESRPLYALPAGPPPPVSAEKLQKLNVLLQQYKADQITPEQYHEERAKILAGP
jgi:hypothetical protein